MSDAGIAWTGAVGIVGIVSCLLTAYVVSAAAERRLQIEKTGQLLRVRAELYGQLFTRVEVCIRTLDRLQALYDGDQSEDVKRKRSRLSSRFEAQSSRLYALAKIAKFVTTDATYKGIDPLVHAVGAYWAAIIRVRVGSEDERELEQAYDKLTDAEQTFCETVRTALLSTA